MRVGRKLEHVRADDAGHMFADGVDDHHWRQIARGVGEVHPLPRQIHAESIGGAVPAFVPHEGSENGEELIGVEHARGAALHELAAKGHVCHREFGGSGEIAQGTRVAGDFGLPLGRLGELEEVENFRHFAGAEQGLDRHRIKAAAHAGAELARAQGYST